MGVVAMFSLMALSLTGGLDAATSLEFLGNSNVILIGAMMAVAVGFSRTQFCSKVTLGIPRAAKRSFHVITLGYCVLGAFLAQFIQFIGYLFLEL